MAAISLLLNIAIFVFLFSSQAVAWFTSKKSEGIKSANKELFGVLIIISFLNFFCSQSYYTSRQSSENLKSIAQADRVSDSIRKTELTSAEGEALSIELTTTAIEINKTCPIKYDNGMRLDSVKANPFDTTFIFFYCDNNFSMEGYDLKKLKDNLYKIKREELKKDTSLNYLRNHKVKITQNYFDKNGIFICKLDFAHY